MFSRCVQNDSEYPILCVYELKYTPIRFNAGNEGWRCRELPTRTRKSFDRRRLIPSTRRRADTRLLIQSAARRSYAGWGARSVPLNTRGREGRPRRLVGPAVIPSRGAPWIPPVRPVGDSPFGAFCAPRLFLDVAPIGSLLRGDQAGARGEFLWLNGALAFLPADRDLPNGMDTHYKC